MNHRKLFPVGTAVVGLAAVVGSIALASQSQDRKPADQQQMQLPPGWTQEDMQACIEAGTPGEMHKFLAESAGEWRGVNKMWMAPDTEAMTSESSAVITPIMDGRFVKMEMKGEMPGGMGPFNGFAIYGYDNVSKKFVASWIDNMGTGIMQGTGERSSDGTTLTWNYTYNCPITKKEVTMREVETITGPNSRRIEGYNTDPKSGKEYKMMSIELTRKS